MLRLLKTLTAFAENSATLCDWKNDFLETILQYTWFSFRRQIKIGHRRRKQALQWFWAPVYVLAMKLDKLCLQFCTQSYKGFIWVGKPSPSKQMEPSLGNSLRQLQGWKLFHRLLLDIAHYISKSVRWTCSLKHKNRLEQMIRKTGSEVRFSYKYNKYSFNKVLWINEWMYRIKL